MNITVSDSNCGHLLCHGDCDLQSIRGAACLCVDDLAALTREFIHTADVRELVMSDYGCRARDEKCAVACSLGRELRCWSWKRRFPAARADFVFASRVSEFFEQFVSSVYHFNARHWPHCILVLKKVEFSGKMNMEWELAHLSGRALAAIDFDSSGHLVRANDCGIFCKHEMRSVFGFKVRHTRATPSKDPIIVVTGGWWQVLDGILTLIDRFVHK